MTRSELREYLFKLLFRVEFNEPEDMVQQKELFFADDEVRFSQKDETYIAEKFERIKAALPELDEALFAKAEGWTANRIGKVELTIFRLAIYEILVYKLHIEHEEVKDIIYSIPTSTVAYEFTRKIY